MICPSVSLLSASNTLDCLSVIEIEKLRSTQMMSASSNSSVSESTAVSQDADCDGVLTAEDCDDSNDSLLAQANDQDCDGILTAEDCDDTDPSTANDMDCDGVITAEDCDDSNPDFSEDADNNGTCDGMEYCDGSYVVTSESDMEAISYCVEIYGSLVIEHNSVSGFSNLVSIGGDLIIGDDSIGHVDGFLNLRTVGGSLTIADNFTLYSLDGFSSLEIIDGNLTIRNNSSLDNLNGLSDISSVGGDVGIRNNFALCESLVDAFITHLTTMGWNGFADTGGNKSC